MEKNEEDQIMKDVRKVVGIFCVWFLALIAGFIFIDDHRLGLIGIWLLITGVVMMINRKRYENWHNKYFKDVDTLG